MHYTRITLHACFVVVAALVLCAGCQESGNAPEGAAAVDTPESNGESDKRNATQDQSAKSKASIGSSQTQSSTAQRSNIQEPIGAKKNAKDLSRSGELSEKTTLIADHQKQAMIESQIAKGDANGKLSTPGEQGARPENAKASSLSEHEYEPPFGERTNLFRPVDSESDDARRLRQTGGAAIQLKGFAKIDQVKAILSLSGRVITLSEGEEKEGIRAIRVQPPEVQLQKNRRRWTLTLEK